MKNVNRVMLCDSYKMSHTKLYPKDTKYMFDYMEARGGEYPSTIFFGLQAMLQEYFVEPITEQEVQEAHMYATMHGEPFDIEGWMYIVNELKGKLPIRIKAVKEGTLVPVSNILMSVESTDEKVFWIASWFETFIMKVWYPTTIATKSYYVKQTLKEFSDKTGSGFVDFQFHNFSDRGCSSVESASISGASHLTQFQGTDNFHSLKYIQDNYGTKEIKAYGYSIPATEHSTISSWTRKNEFDMVMNYLETYKDKELIACVADTYDVFNFTNRVTSGEFKEKIESDEYPKFVIRPDSGSPIEVINAMINIMEDNSVSFTVNDKGYKVWDKYSILWGDGITPNTIKEILEYVTERGYSSDCIAFGSGGDLAQNITRDTSKFAIKCSAIRVNNDIVEVFKDPITDHGKKSKKGILSLYKNKDGFFTDVANRAWEDGVVEMLEVVYEDGELKRYQTFDEIREMSK